ncbi:tubulin monoglutamylase TTLL4 isoform X2 [Ascaphus truei]|uniref:tubulin monoglutamylase TTLL4 isoform X2 n=1 Tax=Ascaphus truei TaxID=8439 RepID=UPI003F597089
MASAGIEPYSVGLRCQNNHKLVSPANLERPKESNGRTLTTQVTPIWKLSRKYVNAGRVRRQVHSVVPRAYYVSSYFNDTVRSPIPAPLLTAPSGSLHHPRSLHDNFERALVFQRPVNGHKPYQKLESPSFRSEVAGQNPFSSIYRSPQAKSAVKFPQSAMTSSLIDQFHLPSAAGEPLGIGPRSPSSITTKLTSNTCRPVLNTNSFLRPSSAKVPLHLHLENRKTKTSPHTRVNSASWHHGEKGDWGQSNGEVQSFCHNFISMEQISNKTSSDNLQGFATARIDGTAWQVREDGYKADTLQSREVPLTEAVRRLTENRDLVHSSSDPQLEATPKPVCHSDLVYASCQKKVPTALHPVCKKEAESCNLESDGLCLNGNLSLPSTNSASICTKRISAHLLAMGTDASDQSTSCQAINSSALKSEVQQPVKADKTQGVNITVMATQISTIHLNKTCVAKETQLQNISKDLDNRCNLPVPNPQPDGAEEQLADGLGDSEQEGEEEDEEDEDDTSDNSSITRVLSTTSLSAVSRHCAETLDQIPAHEDTIVTPAFTTSLFPNVPPTIYFGTQDETVEVLPWGQRKLMKWRMSPVTPNVVKQAVARSHFRTTKKNHDWLGCWGYHMKSPAFKTIREHQKLNHFPGSFQIGRKDRLWRNLSKMQMRFGRREFNFFPQSFVLPQDIKLLKKAWEEGGNRQKWIVKPPASARGMGIQVIHKWSQLPKKRPLLVQRYLHKPYLISGSKFDLRIYVYVTSYDPLRVYLFTDGLVRFASCKYSSSMKSLGNKFMHLTNYSVNKHNADYKANSDQTACQGHKWALKALWSYLNQKGFNSDAIWEKIKDMVIKTIIASEPYVNSLVKMYVPRPYCCHELFGFDIMLDENLKPWVLEVNISPSLHSNSPLDVNIKGQMIRDLLNLAGFVLPNKDEISPGILSDSSSTISVTSPGKDRGRSVHNEDKLKRLYYLGPKVPDKDLYGSVLDQLTSEDVRILVATEDELSRCGQFERVFPSPISSRYLRFFEQPRYFNILINQWEQKYYASRERGHDLLKSLCLMGFHSGTAQNSSVWSLPKSQAHSDSHLNGFTRAEVIKLSRSPVKQEGCGDERPKSFNTSPFHQNPRIPEQPEPSERPLLPQSLANVPEAALVM